MSIESTDTGHYRTIFVGHANPEDNYFSAWLTSKLRLMGYDVWCDTEALAGGEDFWNAIAQKIRNQSAKYLFVATNVSIVKEGTSKELAIADTIKDRKNFIIPLRLDDVAFSNFPPEIIRKYTIDFSTGWGDALQKLSDKLQLDLVPKAVGDVDMLPFWYSSSGIDCDKPIFNQPEKYLSNWFEVELPPHIYFHHLLPFQRLQLEDLPYPAKVDLKRNIVISFACAECINNYASVETKREMGIDEFLSDSEPVNLENVWDARRKNAILVEFLNNAFAHYALSKGLNKYELSGHRPIFYFPQQYPKISLHKYGRRPRALHGRDDAYNWHFALEANGIMQPLLGYFITHHVIFTKDDSSVPPPFVQHVRRRGLAKDWYNRKWRDLLLAAMLSLSDNTDEFLHIPVCKHQSVKMSTYPVSFVSPVGYLEPNEENINVDD